MQVMILFYFFILFLFWGGSLLPPRLNIFTVGNMGVMICLGQGRLHSLSASSCWIKWLPIRMCFLTDLVYECNTQLTKHIQDSLMQEALQNKCEALDSLQYSLESSLKKLIPLYCDVVE